MILYAHLNKNRGAGVRATEKDLNISRLLDLYGGVMNEKQRNVLRCYYDEDLSLSEIAENEGISRQGASDLIRRAEQQLRFLDDNLRLQRVSELSERLLAGIPDGREFDGLRALAAELADIFS